MSGTLSMTDLYGKAAVSVKDVTKEISRAGDLDVIRVNGYGWPTYLDGVMNSILSSCREYAKNTRINFSRGNTWKLVL